MDYGVHIILFLVTSFANGMELRNRNQNQKHRLWGSNPRLWGRYSEELKASRSTTELSRFLAEPGFDPGTSGCHPLGLWAQRNSSLLSRCTYRIQPAGGCHLFKGWGQTVKIAGSLKLRYFSIKRPGSETFNYQIGPFRIKKGPYGLYIFKALVK